MCISNLEELFRKTAEAKLLRDDPQRVLQLAHQAYELSQHHQSSDAHWFRVAAYRLAHLLLRTEPNSREVLHRADELLGEAMEEGVGDSIGALPAIYRVAVLVRLRQLEPSADIDETIGKLFRLATQQLSFARRSTSGPELQTETFNMLELCAYAAGIPYDALRGLGGATKEISDGYSGEWRVVSNLPDKRSTSFSESFARRELESALAQHPTAFVFWVTAPGIGGQFRLPGHQWQTWNQEKTLHYLAVKLYRPEIAPQMLSEQLQIPSSEATRTVKKRLGEKLGEILGRPFKVDDHLTEASGVPIFGIIRKPLLPR